MILDQSTHGQAQELMSQGEWRQAAALYEQAAEANPQIKTYAWYLGLALVMLGQEEEAQLVWMMVLAQGSSEEIEAWTQELLIILDAEAERQQLAEAHQQAWALRQ
ncbi:MAG: tetratricopeptide repeat protein, partial [Elainellaceae cyanobacterium]